MLINTVTPLALVLMTTVLNPASRAVAMVIPNPAFLNGDFLPHYAKSMTSWFYKYLNLIIEILSFFDNNPDLLDDVHILLMTLTSESILSPHHRS